MQRKLWMMVLKLYFPYFAILIEGVSLGAFCSAPSIENRLVSSRSSDTSFPLQEQDRRFWVCLLHISGGFYFIFKSLKVN